MRIVDARSLDRADFAAALELQQTLDRDRDPGLPVTPAAELRAVFDDDATDYCRHQRIVAFDGDRATAIGHLELNSDATNANLAGVEITPTDDSTAAAVLAELLRRARADGPLGRQDRTSVIAWGDHTPAAHAFWTGRTAEQESRLAWPRWTPSSHPARSTWSWCTGPVQECIDALVATANAMDAPTGPGIPPSSSWCGPR